MACRLGNGVDEALADELPLAFQRLAQLLVRSRDIYDLKCVVERA